jgi:hypothetical protein
VENKPKTKNYDELEKPTKYVNTKKNTANAEENYEESNQ